MANKLVRGTYRISWICLQRCVGYKFIGNEFGTNKLCHFEKITIPGHPKEESNRVADVAHDELNGEWRISNIEVTTPPVCNFVVSEYSVKHLSEA